MVIDDIIREKLHKEKKLTPCFDFDRCATDGNHDHFVCTYVYDNLEQYIK